MAHFFILGASSGSQMCWSSHNSNDLYKWSIVRKGNERAFKGYYVNSNVEVTEILYDLPNTKIPTFLMRFYLR